MIIVVIIGLEVAMSEYVCKRCGYDWVSRIKKPKCCPRCKSYLWEEEPNEQK